MPRRRGPGAAVRVALARRRRTAPPYAAGGVAVLPGAQKVRAAVDVAALLFSGGDVGGVAEVGRRARRTRRPLVRDGGGRLGRGAAARGGRRGGRGVPGAG